MCSSDLGLLGEELVLKYLKLKDAAHDYQGPDSQEDGQDEKLAGMKRGLTIGHRLSLTSDSSKLGPGTACGGAFPARCSLADPSAQRRNVTALRASTGCGL